MSATEVIASGGGSKNMKAVIYKGKPFLTGKLPLINTEKNPSRLQLKNVHYQQSSIRMML